MIAIGFLLFALGVVWATIQKNPSERDQIARGVIVVVSLLCVIAGTAKWLWEVAP